MTTSPERAADSRAEDLPKAWDPGAVESAIYQRWLDAGYFTADPTSAGYWVVSYNGWVVQRAGARDLGCQELKNCSNYSGQRIVGAAATPTGKGLWVLGQKGEVWTVGDAQAKGDARNDSQNATGIVADPTGQGYTIVKSDGGIHARGDARFFGSTGGKRPGGHEVMGIALSLDANGKPNGYWMTTDHGDINMFGAAPFDGSTGGNTGGSRITGITALQNRNGYALVHNDGRVDYMRKP